MTHLLIEVTGLALLGSMAYALWMIDRAIASGKLQGPAGPQGPRGEKGDRGDKGESAQPATASVGSTPDALRVHARVGDRWEPREWVRHGSLAHQAAMQDPDKKVE